MTPQQTKSAQDRNAAIARLFETTFTASDGPEEGVLIGTLVRSLMDTTDPDELHVFYVEDEGFVGACILTRLRHDGETGIAYLLSPVAVAPERQGQGIGQRMISEALEVLRVAGVEAVVTYGDPAFYSRVGFSPVTVDEVAAPFALSQPEGWLAQSLTGQPLTPRKGRARCAPALSDPAYW